MLAGRAARRVEVEDRAGLRQETGVAREEPGALLPWRSLAGLRCARRSSGSGRRRFSEQRPEGLPDQLGRSAAFTPPTRSRRSRRSRASSPTPMGCRYVAASAGVSCIASSSSRPSTTRRRRRLGAAGRGRDQPWQQGYNQRARPPCWAASRQPKTTASGCPSTTRLLDGLRVACSREREAPGVEGHRHGSHHSQTQPRSRRTSHRLGRFRSPARRPTPRLRRQRLCANLRRTPGGPSWRTARG
jgi:hypothetical protein